MELLEVQFAGNTIRNWLLGVAGALAVFVVLRVFKAILVGRLHALAKRTQMEWDDIVVAALRRTSPSLF